MIQNNDRRIDRLSPNQNIGGRVLFWGAAWKLSMTSTRWRWTAFICSLCKLLPYLVNTDVYIGLKTENENQSAQKKKCGQSAWRQSGRNAAPRSQASCKTGAIVLLRWRLRRTGQVQCATAGQTAGHVDAGWVDGSYPLHLVNGAYQ